MDELVSQQDTTLSLIKNVQTNFKKSPKHRLTKGYIQTRIDTLYEYWEQFRTTHHEISKIATRSQKTEHAYFLKDVFAEGEEVYFDIKAELHDRLEICKGVEAAVTSKKEKEINVEVKLPQINIPVFYGNYQDWSTFRDVFKSLVHENAALGKVQKLHYLKSSVRGEAEQLLKHINITENNYEIAWEMLQQRYDNKRVIVNSILSRLVSQKKLNSANARGVKELLDTTTECMNNLKSNDVNTTNWDILVIYLVVQKLDDESHKEWEEEIGSAPVKDLPSFTQFYKFLETRFRVLEMIQTSHKDRPSVMEKHTGKSKSFLATTSTPSSGKCAMCNESHTINLCKEFTKLGVNERVQYVQRELLCFNCLSPKHSARFCKSKVSCQHCNRRHHTLLHFFERGNTELQNKPACMSNDSKTERNGVPIIRSHLITQGQSALMATALIHVETGMGIQILRALIDPCSQESFITEAAAQRLQLKRELVEGHVTGVDQMTTRIKYATELRIKSRLSNFSIPCTAYVVKHVTDILPTEKMSNESWSHLQNIQLADPNYSKPGNVDLLIGVNIYTEILMSGVLRGEPGSPIAQQTQFGWIISGGATSKSNMHGIVSMHLNISLDGMVRKFWEAEELINEKKDDLTSQELRAEEIYERTVTRDSDGRYIVALPFTRDMPIIPERSREIALKRLSHLEKRLSANEKLRHEYNEVLKEYLTLGHMEPVIESKRNERAVYLPHHAVVKEDRETTKVRVVFDASCKGSNGVSLNDELLVGPPLHEELRDIIMRWRMHKFCFVADAVKMYRQILVRREDVDYQRILWRFNPEDMIKEFRLLTVTFGTACAPYLALRTLKQIVKDYEKSEKFCLGRKTLNNDFYIDDCLSGSCDEETAIEIQRQLTALLKQSGFELQKWISNSQKFMDEIEPEKRAKINEVDINKKETIKALGITWNVKRDELQVINKINCLTEKKITKRNVLAVIASLFDPMGWLAPTIVMAKIFMQRLWMLGLDWDEELPDEYQREWITFRSQIETLAEIKIPRWIKSDNKSEYVELHGFSDASAKAYAAVIYARVKQCDGEVSTSLLMAKTKVAPIKQISLPRLELCAAVLVCKLIKRVAEAMRIDLANTYAWSDSKVVLAWINGDPTRWNTYVKNRVMEIHNTLSTTWLYVGTKENPADPASRGILPKKLKDNEIWWKGPAFLLDKGFEIPSGVISETDLERRESLTCATTYTVHSFEDENVINLLTKYSNLRKLLVVVAWILRWLLLKRNNEVRRSLPGYVTQEEREKALTICVKLSQRLEFPDEIEQLSRGCQLKRGSRLIPLTPFIDDEGVLRVGGRLKHADIEYLSKHPIIISKSNVLLPLLLNEAHMRTMHGGPQMMITYLRQRYWLIDAGNTVKRYVRNCMVCARQRATSSTQLMGDLPECRVKPSRPFLISGVDFAGPIHARMSKGRGSKSYKAYIALFICMVTKAIHIELVSDMTTETFLAAYKRFISRRGICKEIWSDNGTTFVSASKEILEMWKQGKTKIPDDIASVLDGQGTKWRFVPPRSPNFGGLWEAGVKSIKFHMKRVIGDSTLTFEELNTVLNQIEACLNSRPLSPISDHPGDYEPLTPAHFLVGESLITIPEKDYTNMSMHSLSRWQLCQRMMQSFWRKWQSEYMTRLQERPKWMTPKREFDIGELVLIKDTRCPPSKWSLRRILKKYPGRDNLTRTYDVRTTTGVYTRTVSKLCSLPNV